MTRDDPTSKEHNLVLKAREGDHRAFTELVRSYEQLVYGYAYKVCRDHRRAEETLHDTFINVYRNLKRFDGRSKLSTWIYSIVTNNCLMKRRRRKLEEVSVPIEELTVDRSGDGQSHGAILEHPTAKRTPLDDMLGTELRTAMDRAIQKLPMKYRVVFVLRDLEGRDAEETAKILKISVEATKSRLRRARAFLKEELQEFMAA